jgi:hypothetical protein
MVIFNEAIAEIMSQDSDLKTLYDLVIKLQKDEIEIIVEHGKDVTPLTRFSLEKFHNQRSLLSPEKVKRLSLESIKTRLFNEVHTFICTNCWDFLQMTSLNHLEKTVSCPKCHSTRIGVSNKPMSVLKKISVKRKNKLTEREQTIVKHVKKSAALVAKYGRRAIVVLAGKSLHFSEVEKILNKTERINDTLYELIIEAEQRALTDRY